MFGSEILEVTIGIIFIYVLVSIICTAIREGIEAWLKTRAAYLWFGIRELLHDPSGHGLTRSLYEHPLIHGLFSGAYQTLGPHKRALPLTKGADLPSYIPASNFAIALMDIAARGPNITSANSSTAAPTITAESIRNNILNVENAAVQRVLLTALDVAQGDLDKAQKYIEAWYDSAMDRVAGWYKRSSQWVIFWIGLVLAFALNINTITIADYLYRNEAARDVLVARAEAAVADPTFLDRTYDEVRQELGVLDLPIGWAEGWGTPARASEVLEVDDFLWWWYNVLAPSLGWLLTALAATLGAPFWFDVLNKVMVIRSTVKPHEKSPEEASEDRQLRPRGVTEVMVEAPSGGRPAGGSAAGGSAGREGDLPRESAVASEHEENDVDGCDVQIERVTPDEELPAAEGGVA